ncbi:MAG: cro/C1-type protein [Patescibacteria group bacterium]|jgi:transcriptional regulator with XRE-family HTH domain|nr:cro/C1-type protein [Patescibacteria group bacterium]
MNLKKYFEQQNIKLTSKEKLAIKVGGLITYARLYSGLSQKELADKIGTQQPSIARAEKSEMIASIEFLDKIARAAGLIFDFGFTEKVKTAGVVNITLHSVLSPYTYRTNTFSSSGKLTINKEFK